MQGENFKAGSLRAGLILAAFISVVGMCSCTKHSGSFSPTPLPSIGDTTITDTSIFIDITLDGARTLGIQNGANGPYSWGTEWGGLIVDTSQFIYNRLGTTFVSPDTSSAPQFDFSIGNLPDSVIAFSPIYFPPGFTDSFFVAANYGLSVKSNDTIFSYIGLGTDTLTNFGRNITKTLLTPGVTLLWIDSTGTFWETCNGSADQAGSYFTITENQPYYGDVSTAHPYGIALGTIITAKFDVKLYDDNGHVKHLTNGRFRLSILL